MIDGPVPLTATSLVVAGKAGDAFKERRFADAVLTRQDCQRLLELHLEVRIPEQRQAERIGVRCRDAVSVKPDPSKIRGVEARAGFDLGILAML